MTDTTPICCDRPMILTSDYHGTAPWGQRITFWWFCHFCKKYLTG